MAPTTSGPTFAITPRDIRVPAAQMPNVTSQGAVDIAGLPGPEARSPVDLETGGWYWRVSASDGDDEGPFSDPQPF